MGRWWRDEVAEIDVLGLLQNRTRLIGATRWQTAQLTDRDLRALNGKITYLPEPDPELEMTFWNRGGAAAEVSRQRGVTVFTPADMV